jgi:benzoylformate decarboxylase
MGSTATDRSGIRNGEAWGSDVIADVLRALGYPYALIVPGASFRGLHDSIVNHLGNAAPQIITCLHENHAVSIADGYSRVTEKPLLVILHSNVGLMNGSMAIYNAWCDRRPMMIVGATGPVDAHHRRPWIDWVHTSRDQGALVRSFVKWDDQPASVEASVEALLRADQITRTAPSAPVYVCLDAYMQEAPLNRNVALPPPERYHAAPLPLAPAVAVERIVTGLRHAKHPLVLAGRVSRSEVAWSRRIEFAERFGATVLTSAHHAPAFPALHPLHCLPPAGDRPTKAEGDLLNSADFILSLDWLDLAGFLRSRTGAAQTQQPHAAQIAHCSLDQALWNGWSMDHQALAAVDIPVATHPDTLIEQMLTLPPDQLAPIQPRPDPTTHWAQERIGPSERAPFDLTQLALVLADWAARKAVTFARLPIGWPQRACVFDHPLSFMGKDGGGAVGTGPAHTVGVALALRNSGRIVVGVIGDGDFAMGMNALWTAANQRLPMLLIIANNQSYFNDEVHQERIATQRRRPVENKSVGQRLSDPAMSLVDIARGQGFRADRPVSSVTELRAALARATDIVGAGGQVLIDARIAPGYAKD